MAILRLVKPKETEIAMDIINMAKALLKSQGIDQWQSGYPDYARIEQDVNQATAYFIEEDGDIMGYLCADFGGEPAYEHLKGDWATTEPYVVLHRLAFTDKARGKGLATTAFKLVEELSKSKGVMSFRVDTDEANKTMQHILKKNGFTYRGVIWFDNSEKIAFDKIIV